MNQQQLKGKDSGSDPYTAILCSLAAFTLSTLRMYMDRKRWEILETNIAEKCPISKILKNTVVIRTTI